MQSYDVVPSSNTLSKKYNISLDNWLQFVFPYIEL